MEFIKETIEATKEHERINSEFENIEPFNISIEHEGLLRTVKIKYKFDFTMLDG